MKVVLWELVGYMLMGIVWDVIVGVSLMLMNGKIFIFVCKGVCMLICGWDLVFVVGMKEWYFVMVFDVIKIVDLFEI